MVVPTLFNPASEARKSAFCIADAMIADQSKMIIFDNFALKIIVDAMIAERSKIGGCMIIFDHFSFKSGQQVPCKI